MPNDNLNGDPRCQRCAAPLAGQTVGAFCAKCLLQLALDPPPEVFPPSGSARVRYFGDYELVEEIARGGMGVVFKARQVSLNRLVALKMILAGDFSSPAMIERFQTEAEAAARLEHPNIVPIYEIGMHDGLHYFSMRFVEGGTLTQALAGPQQIRLPLPGAERGERAGERGDRASHTRESCGTPPLPGPLLHSVKERESGVVVELRRALVREKFTSRRAAELMVKVARAVHHAHQRGIIHRDLKPGNILLDAEGEPHVADFGLAKLLEHDSALTQSATVLGTPAYMAPEQAAGQMKEATTAVDIYSLGAIFYELLTGRPPFVGRSALDVLAQVREREPASPQSIQPELDRDVAVICLKCLEKDPARRYGSAAALAEELQRWLAHEPIQARRATAPERVWKWAQRKPVVAGLLVAILLVAGAGLVGILLQTRRANEHALRVKMEMENTRFQSQLTKLEAAKAHAEKRRAEDELWNAKFNEARALRLRGGSGARVESTAMLRWLLRRPARTEEQELRLREEAIAQLALADLAPPERWVANPASVFRAWSARFDRYVWSDGTPRIELREFPSERTLAVFTGPAAANYHASWLSPDEAWVGACFANGEMRVWNVHSRAERLRVARVEHASFSPDSRTLLTITARGVELHALDRDGAARLLQPGRRAQEAVYSGDGKFLLVLLPEPDQQVEIWDADSGLTHATFTLDFPPTQAAWNADGTRLALGGDRGRLEWRAVGRNEDGSLRVGDPVPLTGHLGAVQTIQFSADGFTLLTYAWGASSILWDLTTGLPLLQELRQIAGFDAAGERAVVAHARSNGVARILSPAACRTVAFAGQPREAHAVRVSPDGRLGVAIYASTVTRVEGDCILWDFVRRVEIARFKGIDAVFSADSRTLFTFERFDANRVRRYDVSVEHLAQRPPGWDEGRDFYQGRRGESFNAGALAPDGRTLIVAAADAVLFLDTQGELPPRSWLKPAYSVVPSRDGKWVATRYRSDPAALRKVENGEAVFRAPNSGRLILSPDSRWMATADVTGVQMRELRAPSFVAHYTNHFSEPGPLAFAPDSRTYAVVFNQTHVRLHDTATGRELATLSPPRLAAIKGGRALNFSPDGHWLLAAKHDGEVVAWHLPTLGVEMSKLGFGGDNAP